MSRPETSAPVAPAAAKRQDGFLVAGLVLAALLFTLRLIDLEADLPWGLTWSRGVYDDEGIYARNAVWWVETGRWLVPADYNTAVNYPVPFLLQALTFRILGTGLAAARLVSVAFAGGLIVVTALLARRTLGNVAAVFVALLLASHPLLFFYSRYAHLDVAMAFWCVLAVLLMVTPHPRPWRSGAAAIAALLGLLTKTSAIFVVPVLVFVPLVSDRYRGDRVRPMVWLLTTLLTGSMLYVLVWVRPHAADFLAVAQSVTVDRMRWELGWIVSGFLLALANLAVRDSALTILALLTAISLPALRVLSPTQKVVLAGAALWILGYLGLVGLTHYLPTRYFVPTVPALALIAGLAITAAARMGRVGRVVAIALAIGIVGDQLRAVGVYLVGPPHSMRDVARMVSQELRRSDLESPLLMGHSSGTPALIVGMPSIGEFLGSGDVAAKLRAHTPSHHVSDGPIRDETRRALEAAGYQPLWVDSVRVYGPGPGERAGGVIHLYRLVRGAGPGGSAAPESSFGLDAGREPVDDRSMGRQAGR